MTDTQDAGAEKRPRWFLTPETRRAGDYGFGAYTILVNEDLDLCGLKLKTEDAEEWRIYLNALEDQVQVAEQRIKEEHAAALDVWASLETVEQQLREARNLAVDAIEQAYGSTELGGIFFDTMSALVKRLTLTASPAQPTEGTQS